MTYRYEAASADNLLALDDEGVALASMPGTSALVGVKELSLPQLKSCWHRFMAELREAICDALSKTPAEFSEWHVFNGWYDLGDGIINPESCVAFKRVAVGGPNLHYLRQKTVIEALLDLHLIPRTDAHGRPRKNMVRGEGGVPAFCQRLPPDQQRSVLRHIFADQSRSLDDILDLGQHIRIGSEEVDRLLGDARDAETGLNELASALWQFNSEQTWKSRGEKRPTRHFAAIWFCAYLAREGYLLLPRAAESRSPLPQLLTPFMWTLFVPPEARNLALHMIHRPGEKKKDYTFRPMRELILYTNFFRCASRNFIITHLLQLKREYTTSETGHSLRQAAAVHAGHGMNLLFDAYLDFHGKTWEDVGSDARFFGGGRRLADEHGREAFAWVENPRAHKTTLYQKLAGEPPKQFPEFIQEWARDLRSLLPKFGVKATKGKIDSLNHWLVYLMKVGDAAPKGWQDIDRERHINHVGLGSHLTFVDFLRGVDRTDRQKIVSNLQQAWHLAAARDGFASKISCPIDIRIDGSGLGGNDRNAGRTRRKSIPEHVYHVLVEENRRDNFAFARSLLADAEGPRVGRRLRLHWRTLTDPDTGKRTEVFWPGIPMILDLILTMGVRQSSAIWLDSGEGDDYWVDRERIENYPNPLPSRTRNRSTGFLRVFHIGPKESDKVLGMYLAVNKTGPYGAPWVDPVTAGFFVEMRDWQARWNQRRAPVKASRDDLETLYAAEGKIPEVYPLFRDPESRSAHPPTSATLYAYWTALLQHCEPLVEEKLGHHEPLLLNGKPRWDLHSLRVTTISTLLENGVEPWIVAELVGHSSVAMTWHYKDVDSRKTHLALQQVYERRRRQVIEDLETLAKEEFVGTEEEFDARLQQILRGLVKLRDDNVGTPLLLGSFAEGGRHEMFSHGVCPGGDCKSGGELHKNAYQPVFRPRACSRCRYRLTGPAFLAGLVHRMNSLMVEIKASMDQEARLNLDIEQAEDRGEGKSGAVLVLRGLVTRERELRDELYAEWCAELATIRMAEGMLGQAGETEALPVLTGMDARSIRAQMDTVHQLALLHGVLADGNLILGASLEIPDGLRERRDAMLLEVARHNDMSAFFYKLKPEHRRQALDRFGDLLLDHVADAGDLQMLLDGHLAMADRPALEVEVQEFLAEGESVAMVGGAAPKALTGI